MKVLVTGGAGFIGSHLVETLLKKGVGVRVLDNLSTGKMYNYIDSTRDFEPGGAPEIIVNNMPVDEECIMLALDGIDVVFHLAALPSAPFSVCDPYASYENGTDLTFKVLYYAKKSGVKRLVYASSSAVYGKRCKLPQEEDQGLAPISPYAATKAAGESLCHAFSSCYDIDTVSLRFFNVYGPRQDPSSQYSGVIARFCEAFADGRGIEIHGKGEQSRDFTYVSDVAQAIYLAGTKKISLDGIAINIGCGQSHSILDVLETLEGISGERKKRVFKDRRPGDTEKTMADIQRARGTLGYIPKVSLKEGLKETLCWYEAEDCH